MSDLFLPPDIALQIKKGPYGVSVHNWAAYQYAIETLLRLRGLETHLTSTGAPPDASAAETERWNEEDRLCKAIVTLNVRHSFTILDWHTADEKSASAVWRELCELAGVEVTHDTIPGRPDVGRPDRPVGEEREEAAGGGVVLQGLIEGLQRRVADRGWVVRAGKVAVVSRAQLAALRSRAFMLPW
ncbi:hypothetical protein C8Q76DRAFT_795765 [Earliella scabrosa]|nr:hypothetical protein C8Q76DRAFT_795765 [Earliella scabrosa]